MKILVRARLFGQDRGQASAGLDGHPSLLILVNLRIEPPRPEGRIAPYDLQHADPPTPSGLATGLPHYSGQVRPAVLCVTASISGICKAGALYSSFYVCLLDAALD